LQPIVAGAPFERISIVLTGPHIRTPMGSVYNLTCVYVFTKLTEAFPTLNKEAGFLLFQYSITLLLDTGTEVDSSTMCEECKIVGYR